MSLLKRLEAEKSETRKLDNRQEKPGTRTRTWFSLSTGK